MTARRKRKRKITDEAKFREMWATGVTVKDMAAEFGVTKPAITQNRKRLGLSARTVGRRRRHCPEEIVEEEKAPDPEVQMQAHLHRLAVAHYSGGIPLTYPGRHAWTLAQDKAIAATRGRYAALADLAEKWGMQSGDLAQRWHLVRAIK